MTTATHRFNSTTEVVRCAGTRRVWPIDPERFWRPWHAMGGYRNSGPGGMYQWSDMDAATAPAICLGWRKTLTGKSRRSLCARTLAGRRSVGSGAAWNISYGRRNRGSVVESRVTDPHFGPGAEDGAHFLQRRRRATGNMDLMRGAGKAFRLRQQFRGCGWRAAGAAWLSPDHLEVGDVSGGTGSH